MKEIKNNNEMGNNEGLKFDPNKKIEKNDNNENKELNNSQMDKFNPDSKIETRSELKENYKNDLAGVAINPKEADRIKAMDFKDLKVVDSKAGRIEFNGVKDDLKNQWEKMTGNEWPRYKEYVFNDNGKPIRKPGDKYDAHHIQPLQLGGKNVVENITPLHANDHYDSKFIHQEGGNLDKLVKNCKGEF